MGVFIFHRTLKTSVLHYWDEPLALVADRLDRLRAQGYTSVFSGIPWAYFEADRVRLLQKYLLMALKKGFYVQLCPTPEKTWPIYRAGFPKDLCSLEYSSARPDGRSYWSFCPPKVFQIPSFGHPEVSKRYFQFLNKIHFLVRELSAQEPQIHEKLIFCISSSFFQDYFEGDCSQASLENYRTVMEAYQGQAELKSAFPSRERRDQWFRQQSEDVFRARVRMALTKNGFNIACQEVDFIEPYSDGDVAQVVLSEWVHGYSKSCLDLCLEKFQKRVKEVAGIGSKRAAKLLALESVTVPRSLSEAEKRFFQVYTLVHALGTGASFLGSFNEGVQTSWDLRLEKLRDSFILEDWRLPIDSILWSQCHDFSGQNWEHSWHEVLWPYYERVSQLQQVEDLEKPKNIVLDPRMVITLDVLKSCFERMKKGCIVVFSQEQNMTSQAREYIFKEMNGKKQVQFQSSAEFILTHFDSGALIQYAWDPEKMSAIELEQSLKLLFAKDEKNGFSSEKNGLEILKLHSQKRSGEELVFVFNSSSEKKSIHLKFNSPRVVSGYAGWSRDASISTVQELSFDVPAFSFVPFVQNSQINLRNQKNEFRRNTRLEVAQSSFSTFEQNAVS